MAGLLRDCKHEDNNAKMGRMATPKIQMLYLEAMEETKKEGGEPNAIGDSRMASMGGEQLPESLLAYVKKWTYTKGNLKRKTRTGRIHKHP